MISDPGLKMNMDSGRSVSKPWGYFKICSKKEIKKHESYLSKRVNGQMYSFVKKEKDKL